MGLRIVFAGTPTVAVDTLAALVDSQHEVVGVITRPPKRRGRSKRLIPSEVAAYALDHNIPLREVDRPGDEATMEWISSLSADLGVVVAYGALLSQRLLDLLPLGWVNLHFSSLPDLRGAAPVQRALLRGDTRIGCSVFQLESGMDTGPIFVEDQFEVGPQATSGEVLEMLSTEGSQLVVQTVDQLQQGSAVSHPQKVGEDGEAITYAPKLTRADAYISFRDTAVNTANRARAVNPDPGAWTVLPNGNPMKVRGVSVVATESAPSPGVPGLVTPTKDALLVWCQDAPVAISHVAPAGKSWMKATDWWRGARLGEGDTLGSDAQD